MPPWSAVNCTRRADEERHAVVADTPDQGGVVDVRDDVVDAQFGLHVTVGPDGARAERCRARSPHSIVTVTTSPTPTSIPVSVHARSAGTLTSVSPSGSGQIATATSTTATSASRTAAPAPSRRIFGRCHHLRRGRRRERSLGRVRERIGQWIRAGPVDRLDQRQQRILRPLPVVDPLDRRQGAWRVLGTEVVDLDRDHDPTDGAGVAELGAAGRRSRRRRADDGHDRVRHPQLAEDLVPPRLPAVQLVVAPDRIASRVECACEVGDRPTVPATIVPAVGDEDTGHRTTPRTGAFGRDTTAARCFTGSICAGRPVQRRAAMVRSIVSPIDIERPRSSSGWWRSPRRSASSSAMRW